MSIATLVDIVLAVFMLEAIALFAWSLRRRRMLVVRLVPTLLSGVCLVLALRAVVHQAAWSLVALWLLAAGSAHAIDLAIRLRQGRR
jgi:hypothetical protein